MAKAVVSGYGELAVILQPPTLPIVERLEFLTDTIESYDGSEQNIELRSKARQRFQYQIPIRPGWSQDIFNTIYGAIRKKWAIPVWTDAQYVGRINGGNSQTITVDTTAFDFRYPGLVLYYDSCGQWSIVPLTGITSNSISTNPPKSGSIFRSCYIVPVRVGWVENDIQRPTDGHDGQININYFVDDTIEVSPAAPEQYLSNDIYWNPSLLNPDKIETNIVQRVDVIDFETGVVDRRSPWSRAKFGRQYRSVTVTPTERKAFREFLFRRVGKSRQFWMPTFENDFRLLNTGTITNSLTTRIDSYMDYAQARKNIAIEANGVWYPRSFFTPVPGAGDTMTFTLSSALNIPASSVRRISYLGLNRLNTDSIELNYTSAKACEASFLMLELTP